MKITYLVFLVPLIILSCKKEVNLGNDFNRLVGHWENVGGDDRIHIEIRENGKMKISKSTERGITRRIEYVYKNPNNQIINGVPWDDFTCFELNRNQDPHNGISFTIHPENDTILVDVGEKVDNFYAKGRITKLVRKL